MKFSKIIEIVGEFSKITEAQAMANNLGKYFRKFYDTCITAYQSSKTVPIYKSLHFITTGNLNPSTKSNIRPFFMFEF